MFTPHQFKEGAPNSIPQENLNQNQVDGNPALREEWKERWKIAQMWFFDQLMTREPQTAVHWAERMAMQFTRLTELICTLMLYTQFCTALNHNLMDFGQHMVELVITC